MRVEFDQFTIGAACHIGHSHHTKGENCQDAFAIATDNHRVACTICDGCSGAETETPFGKVDGKSEVGAALLSSFVAKYLLTPKPLESLLETLPGVAKAYINLNNASSYHDEISLVQHISRFWLCTLRGFVLDHDNIYLFEDGDGISELEEFEKVPYSDITHVSHPHYLAYGCVVEPAKWGISPQDAASALQYHKFSLKQLRRAFVSTDGFSQHCDTKLLSYETKTKDMLPRDLRGYQWGKKGKTGLKRWLNASYDKGYFDDDATIITIERGNDEKTQA